jgi:hypothetical protein
MASIVDIEGIGAEYAEKLKGAGVRSTGALLKRGGTAKGRRELAAVINIEESKILKWVNHADLFRVRGVGSEYSDRSKQLAWILCLSSSNAMLRRSMRRWSKRIK